MSAKALVDRLLAEAGVEVTLTITSEDAAWLQETMKQVVDISDDPDDAPDKEAATRILAALGIGVELRGALTRFRRPTEARVSEGWTQEFDQSWAVPDWASQVPGTYDASWHNDAMPSFRLTSQGEGNPDSETLVLWVDHPDPQEREYKDGTRFAITKGDDADTAVVWAGDDEAEAQRQWTAAVSSASS